MLIIKRVYFIYQLGKMRGLHFILLNRGVATGGGVYRYIYPKISNRIVHMWDINTCFEIAMTS